MHLSYALDMSLFRVEVKREKAFITSERKKKLKENNKKIMRYTATGTIVCLFIIHVGNIINSNNNNNNNNNNN